MHHQSAGEEARHLQRTNRRKSMMHHQSAGEEARCHQQSPLRAPAQLRGRGARWPRRLKRTIMSKVKCLVLFCEDRAVPRLVHRGICCADSLSAGCYVIRCSAACASEGRALSCCTTCFFFYKCHALFLYYFALTSIYLRPRVRCARPAVTFS